MSQQAKEISETGGERLCMEFSICAVALFLHRPVLNEPKYHSVFVVDIYLLSYKQWATTIALLQ